MSLSSCFAAAWLQDEAARSLAALRPFGGANLFDQEDDEALLAAASSHTHAGQVSIGAQEAHDGQMEGGFAEQQGGGEFIHGGDQGVEMGDQGDALGADGDGQMQMQGELEGYVEQEQSGEFQDQFQQEQAGFHVQEQDQGEQGSNSEDHYLF